MVKKAAKKARSGTGSRKPAAKIRVPKAEFKADFVKPGNRAAKASVTPSSRTISTLKAKLAAAQARIDELQAWADTDFLLNIYNRRGFERELARSIAYIKRYAATGALIVLDVDRLKPVNDTFGHAAGDVVLKGVVAVLMRHVRSSDVVGRLGGDEFGLLLWNLTESDALAKAAALEDAVDQLTFVFKGKAVTAGASTGVTLLGPMDNVADVLERADRAMYRRKEIRRGSTSRNFKQ